MLNHGWVPSSEISHCHLQQQLHTLVLERLLSMLGSWIGPIEWTLVIRQVVRQPLPRVIPEKMCVEVTHCYRLDQDNSITYFQRFVDSPINYSYDTLMIGLILQSTLVDW